MSFGKFIDSKISPAMLVDSDGVEITTLPVSMTPAVTAPLKVWNAEPVSSTDTSDTFDCGSNPHITVAGNSSGSVVLHLYSSPDGTDWYATGSTLTLGASGGNFSARYTSGFRYHRLYVHSGSPVITAYYGAQ